MPSTMPTATPYQPLVSPSRVVAVSAGGGHSLALQEDGGVWGWGDASSLGLVEHEQEFILSPVELNFLENIAAIDTDDWHTSLFVDKDGRVFRTGYPEDMEALTPLEGIDHVVQAQANRDTVIALRDDGTVWAYGEENAGLDGLLGVQEFKETGQFVQLPFEGIVDIFIQPETALFLREDGRVWIWGRGVGDSFAELLEGDQNPTPRFVDPPELHPDITDAIDVAIGLGLVVARANGVVWQDRGLVPGPPQELLENVVQVDGAVTKGYNLALDTNGQLWSWGFRLDSIDEYVGTPMQIPIPRRVVTASAGASHALALDDEGTVWGWGNTAFGKLGVGVIAERYISDPIPILRSQ
jgi:alpha-tubulin suppressor-like RCC1 family protein